MWKNLEELSIDTYILFYKVIPMYDDSIIVCTIIDANYKELDYGSI